MLKIIPEGLALPLTYDRKTVCVYRLINLVTGKAYIGSTNKPHNRHHEHLVRLATHSHHATDINQDWQKYGAGVFRFELIEVVQEPKHKLVREQFWVNYHGGARSATCYNSNNPLAPQRWPLEWALAEYAHYVGGHPVMQALAVGRQLVIE